MTRSHKQVRTRLIVTICTWFMTIAHAAIFSQPGTAQDFERYRPRTPMNSEGRPEIPDVPADPIGDPTVLIDELQGLVFVNHKDLVTREKLDAVGVQVRSEGLYLLQSPCFEEIASRYLGQPVSLLSLNELVREIIILYRQNDQPVVDVSVPEQDITDGVVQIVVVEGRVGQVVVTGSGYFNPCMLAHQTCVCSGDQIYESLLLEDLRWLNQNPFREVDLRLRSGDVYGETDIVFDVRDRPPVMAYAGYEDTGVRLLGLERTVYGFVWGNAFGRDHTASFQYTADSSFSRLNALSGVYSIPTHRRNFLNVYGSYADIRSDGFVPFDQGGTAWQASVRYDHELFPGTCCPRGRSEHRVQFGFDFKRSNTNLDFGGVNIFNTLVDVDQFVLGYTGRIDDNLGTTRLGAEAYYSPGNLSAHNNDVDYELVRPFASADYFYTRMYLQRHHYLPYGLIFWGNVTGQIADGNLLPNEQMGFGGYNTVRGYDQRVVNGDSGLLINVELRTQPVSLLSRSCHVHRQDELQWLLFYDQGWAYNHTLLPLEVRPEELAGTGFGFRYSLKDRIALRFDWGWQLAELPRFSLATDNSRVHIGAVVTY